MNERDNSCEEQSNEMNFPEKPMVNYWNGSIQSPDVVLLIQNESFDQGEFLKSRACKVSDDDDGSNEKKAEPYITPSYDVSEEVNNEPNVLTTNYNEKFRAVTKKAKKQSLQKRNLGSGHKHVTELW